MTTSKQFILLTSENRKAESCRFATDELGEKVLNERSEFRNLTPIPRGVIGQKITLFYKVIFCTHRRTENFWCMWYYLNKNKKILVIIIIIVLIILLFPKAYDSAGGISGDIEFSNDKKCIGYSYEHSPDGCWDCDTTRYCVGVPIPI